MKFKKCMMLLCLAVLLASCGNESATPTAVANANPVEDTSPTAAATEQPTETATQTAVPTETASPEPTATNTAVPTETATNVPTQTATATATIVPTVTETATSLPTAAATTAPTAQADLPTAVPVSAPPPAPAPAGPNLLTNPGFEGEAEGWINRYPGLLTFYKADGKPQFIHSGTTALAHPYGAGQTYQRVEHSIVPGTTYRAGVWVKLWSSTGIDTTISENPGDFAARICINGNGDGDLQREETHCSHWVTPIDTWQFISVDGIATENGRVAIILHSSFIGPNKPQHNNAVWDDATLGVAPAAATATPVPVTIARPAPVAFDANSLRDSMTTVRSQIEQMGGVLDRMANGEPGKCEEYQGYYDNIILSATYEGVPAEWQGIYNDYIFAVENSIATNEGLNSLCDSGGGGVTQQNYGSGRQGINSSLDRLIPAIEAANGLLGG